MNNPLTLIDYIKWQNNVSLDLIASSQILQTNESGSVEEILSWINQLNCEIECDINLIPLNKLSKWAFDNDLNLRHETGRFFSIEGIKVNTEHGTVKEWYQPIINQPEIGFLGFLCKRIDGVLHFLVQAKIEPGNVNVVQLSPTLQATKSNYTQAHKGSKPLFLDFFLDIKNNKVIVDQLQSEQGARFLRKRNRNVVIEISSNVEIEIPKNFKWMTLGQIKELLKYNNIVNMDSRTVLSSLYLKHDSAIKGLFENNYSLDLIQNGLYKSLVEKESSMYSIEEIISWFTELKTFYELSIEKTGLKNCKNWKVGKYSIHNINNRYFEVVGADIKIVNREVTNWCQPLVRHYESGIAGLILKRINGVYHMLIQAKMEPGNFDVLEMAPTVQCITGSYRKPEYEVPFLDLFLNPNDNCKILYDALQSEEGGRFYHEENRYMVIDVQDMEIKDLPNEYIWITLNQAKTFIKFNNYFNIELRSIIASISPI